MIMLTTDNIPLECMGNSSIRLVVFMFETVANAWHLSSALFPVNSLYQAFGGEIKLRFHGKTYAKRGFTAETRS